MIFYLIIFLNLLFPVISQEIPNDYLHVRKLKFLYDIGKYWKSNTSIGPYRYQNHIMFDSTNNTTQSRIIFGFKNYNYDYLLFGDSRILINDKYYLFYRVNVTNNSDGFTDFHGIEREKSRIGNLKSLEVQYSGIGYDNGFSILQFGRGKQVWVAGNDISLILGENAPSYDYGLIGLNFRKLKMRYFHGFLENVLEDGENINRFIYGKSIEWVNNENIILSLSEIGIYQGLDRRLDISYLNPISNHVEIEMNNRQNHHGNNQNAVWQISFDKYFKESTRFSFNFLIDEITIDSEEKGLGEGNLLAFSSKVLSKIRQVNSKYFLGYFSYTSVGTHTFRHNDGKTNFVSRGVPLGTSLGSDVRKFMLGLKFVDYNKNLYFDLSYSFMQSGEKNIVNMPYQKNENIYKTEFPSGVIRLTELINMKIELWENEFLRYQFTANLDVNDKLSPLDFKIGVFSSYLLPNRFIENLFY
jgi:hypothetical protein